VCPSTKPVIDAIIDFRKITSKTLPATSKILSVTNDRLSSMPMETKKKLVNVSLNGNKFPKAL